MTDPVEVAAKAIYNAPTAVVLFQEEAEQIAKAALKAVWEDGWDILRAHIPKDTAWTPFGD